MQTKTIDKYYRHGNNYQWLKKTIKTPKHNYVQSKNYI